MKYLLWLLALSLALPACAQRQPTKQKPLTRKELAARQAAKQTEPVLIFQRTPCHGTCPTYIATIYADGRVEYEGQRFVRLQGKHTLSLPVATVQEMLAESGRIGFTKLQERYSGNTTDLPATIITVHPAGQPLKAVYAEESIPDNLEQFIKFLQARIDPLTKSTIQATE